jgi:hypothetical protein
MKAGENRHLPIASRLAAAGIIVAFAFILYANSIPLEYALDDKVVITHNQFTQQGIRGIPDIFTHDSFAAAVGGKLALVPGGRYRPLSVATFAIEYHFFGENPHVSHFVNVALYAVTGLLIFFLLMKLFGSLRDDARSTRWYFDVPFLTTMLWLSHPLHTEVIANIKGRDEILAFLAGLYALWLTLRYLESRKSILLVLSAIVFFFGLMSKEHTVTFLAVIPCAAYFFTSHSLKRNLLSLVPLLAATAVFIMVRAQVLGALATEVVPELLNDPFVHASMAERYATVFSTYGVYLKLLFFPHPLTYDYYPFHIPVIGWGSWQAIVPLIVVGALGITVIAGWRKKSVVAFGLVYGFATFSIVSNLFFTIGTMMSERFMYVPSLGFCLIVACVLVERRKAHAVAGVIVIAMVAGFTAKTIARNPVWQDDFTLFTTDVKVSDNSAVANYHAGKQFYYKGRDSSDPDERDRFVLLGIEHLTRAVEIHPGYANALLILAEARYEYDQDYESSIGYLERYLELDPSNKEIWVWIGSLYAKHTNRVDRAVSYLERALEVDPRDRTALFNLGVIYYNRGDYDRSLRRFEALARYHPDDPAAAGYIGTVREAMGSRE